MKNNIKISGTIIEIDRKYVKIVTSVDNSIIKIKVPSYIISRNLFCIGKQYVFSGRVAKSNKNSVEIDYRSALPLTDNNTKERNYFEVEGAITDVIDNSFIYFNTQEEQNLLLCLPTLEVLSNEIQKCKYVSLKIWGIYQNNTLQITGISKLN